MSEQERNKALVQSMFDNVVNNGFDRTAARDLCAADYVHHDPNLPQSEIRGLEAYLDVTSMFPAAFPDLRGEVEDLLAEGDRVAARLTVRGAHQEELMGIPATGNQEQASAEVMMFMPCLTRSCPLADIDDAAVLDYKRAIGNDGVTVAGHDRRVR